MGFYKKSVLTSIIILQIILTAYSVCGIFIRVLLSDDDSFEKTIENNSIDIYFYHDWDYIIANNLTDDKNEKLSAVMLKTFGETFEEEWLKKNLKATVKDILAIVSARQSNFTHIIELEQKKEIYAQTLAVNLSKYSDEELLNWNINPLNLNEDSKFLAENRLRIPDYLSLQDLIGQRIVSGIYENSRRIRDILRNSVYFSIFLNIVLIIALCFLLSKQKALKLSGISTIFGTCISFIFILVVKNIAQNYTGKIFKDQLSFVIELQNYLFNIFTLRFIQVSLIFMVIGILMVLFSFIIGKKTSSNGVLVTGKILNKTLIFFLIPVLLFSCRTAVEDHGFTIYSPKMEEDMHNKGKIEILSVNVLPHVFSGEIPSYNRRDPFAIPENPGALIKIFIKNTDRENHFEGQVLFNGKTGIELLDSKIVSWASVPDIRTGGLLSSKIPPDSIDVYTLNVIDSRFYADGILVEFIYPDSNGSVRQHIEIKEYPLCAERIVFMDSKGESRPDKMIVWLKNNSKEDIVLEGMDFYKAMPFYSMHWWTDSIKPDVLDTQINEMTLKPGETNYIVYGLGEIPFGESILELNVKSEDKSEKIMYQIKPFVSSFDINTGWAGRHLAGSKLFAETVAMMHFNTVHGDSLGYNNTAIGQKYPLKGFGVYSNTEEMNKPENIKNIHGVEFLGEPQMDNRDPQEIFNKMAIYRTSGYPTTLTLTHEPGYYMYAGLVDFPHFDAYRIVAPHADKWGEYTKYGDKNTLWGAPLETAGIYVRSLHEISRPNPVAAWTQAVSGGWFSIWRISSPNPNPTEIRIQAYQKVANGSISLYWFNISGRNVIGSRYALDEIRNINREFLIVEDLLVKSVPFSWENIFMDMDHNVLAGPDFAVLFTTDLSYMVSPVNEFVISSPRTENFTFNIPEYLDNPDSLIKITKDGIFKLDATFHGDNVSFTDTVFITGMYVVYESSEVDYYRFLQDKYNSLIAKEQSVGFDPIRNDGDFDLLREEIMEIP